MADNYVVVIQAEWQYGLENVEIPETLKFDVPTVLTALPDSHLGMVRLGLDALPWNACTTGGEGGGGGTGAAVVIY